MLYRALIKSSSYTTCILPAINILGFYAQNVYNIGLSIPCTLCGILLLTWTEYIMHRFILHYSHTGSTYHYLHGNHHAYPHGKSIHIPILFSSIINCAYFYIALTILSFKSSVNLMMAYQASYILFEHVHMEVHHPYFFLNRNEPFRAFHMYHHLTNKHLAYSFSMPLWDLVFGTFPHDAMTVNWFAYVPIPIISFQFGTKVITQ